MFLCLITASTIHGGMLRGVETLIYFRVSLSGRIYKIDITCVAQNSAQIQRLKQLR